MNASPRVSTAVLLGVVSLGVFGYFSLSRRHAELARELAREQGLGWCYRTLTEIYENHWMMPAGTDFEIVCRYEIDGSKHRVVLGSIRGPRSETLYRILIRRTDVGSWKFGMIHTSNGSSSLTRFREITCPGMELDEYASVNRSMSPITRTGSPWLRVRSARYFDERSIARTDSGINR